MRDPKGKWHRIAGIPGRMEPGARHSDLRASCGVPVCLAHPLAKLLRKGLLQREEDSVLWGSETSKGPRFSDLSVHQCHLEALLKQEFLDHSQGSDL